MKLLADMMSAEFASRIRGLRGDPERSPHPSVADVPEPGCPYCEMAEGEPHEPHCPLTEPLAVCDGCSVLPCTCDEEERDV